MLDVDVSIDLSRSSKLLRVMSFLPTIGPVVEMLRDMQEAYEEVVLEQFDRNSRGGGDWQPIEFATARRKGHTDILVNSRAMRRGLEGGVGLIATVSAINGASVQMGFTTKKRHPKAKMTIADLAAIHHLGLGNNPERRILLAPNDRGNRKILSSMTRLASRIME